ncbi:MAG: hypothetical protein K2N56_04005 [Oscillospiraceae bacterium]|nr:hypothetical protein [Oscillospiraceae bacterium]
MDENIVLLLDIYGDILPKSQREALDLRYNSDLSLGEIAEEMGGISRQAVNSFIKKGSQRLLELEEALGNAARFREISMAADHAESLLKKLSENIGDDIEDNKRDTLDALEKTIIKIRNAANA